MPISRRNFIRIGSISAALVAGNFLGSESGVFAQTKIFRAGNLPSEIYSDALFSYHAETFGKHIGSSFDLFTDGFAESAVLTEIKENPLSNGKKLKKRQIESSENFTLSFRISKPDAPQATYTVIHRELGQFDLLLVPAKNDRGEFLLDAVINRL